MPQRAALAKPRTVLVTSPAFPRDGAIPRAFSCDGGDVSPPIVIDHVPTEAVALALVVDDPDAPRGTWTHWTAWDLPPGTKRIAEGADLAKLGGVEGTTTAGEIGYHGPCPPTGMHRYYFRVFALRERVGLPRGAPVEDVWAALAEKAIAYGEVMGTYARA